MEVFRCKNYSHQKHHMSGKNYSNCHFCMQKSLKQFINFREPKKSVEKIKSILSRIKINLVDQKF